MSEMSEATQSLIEEKGFTVDSVKRTVENSIKAAYKRTFGTADNCVVKFAEDMSEVFVYSRKTIVDGVYDPVVEIEIEEALKLSDECELGDEIDILIDPKKDFALSAVSTGKQTAHQGLNESYKDRLYNEYKEKVGQIVIGYFQRENKSKGGIYVEIGRDVEGVLPAKYQNKNEHFDEGDRIKALVVDVKKTSSALQLILSRIDPNLVKNILELEVPELADKTVEIKKIVRDAGKRTKIAVYTSREDIDPVGSCVGIKGVRIQNVIKEIDGEKIDVLRYEEDPTKFIANALSPATVNRVIITDAEKRQALAIVSDDQSSIAIGYEGHNVRLANRLCDWSIDVKTESEASKMDLSEFIRKPAENLFNEVTEKEAIESEVENQENTEDEAIDVSLVSMLPKISPEVSSVLKGSEYDDIQAFVDAYYDGVLEKSKLLTKEQIEDTFRILNDYVEIVDDSDDEQETEEEKYYCPECGAEITLDMTKCSKCGTELEFQEK